MGLANILCKMQLTTETARNLWRPLQKPAKRESLHGPLNWRIERMHSPANNRQSISCWHPLRYSTAAYRQCPAPSLQPSLGGITTSYKC